MMRLVTHVDTSVRLWCIPRAVPLVGLYNTRWAAQHERDMIHPCRCIRDNTYSTWPRSPLPTSSPPCPLLPLQLYMHGVVVQAERAFARLCPGEPFWPPPPEPDDDDDQAEMLRAAASAVAAKTDGGGQEQDRPEAAGGRVGGVTSAAREEEAGEEGEGEVGEEEAAPVPPQEEGAPEEGEQDG